MIDVLNLALPFFGLIFIGFTCGKFKQIPDTALGWMNFFIVYVSLPALFYRILAQTPLEQLAKVDFVLATSLATFSAFSVSFVIGMVVMRGTIGDSTIAGLAGGYGNIGYMGPGLALATLGAEAAVPVALIFCFDTLLLFSLVPFLMALASPQKKSVASVAMEVVKRIVTNPLVIATAAGIASAAIHFQPPVALDRLMQFLQNASAPCALFTLGVTVALRPLKKMPWEACAAPGDHLCAVVTVRPVRPNLGLHRGADGRAAAGTQRVRVRAAIRHLGRAGLERGADRHARVGGDAYQRDVDGEDPHAAGPAVPVTRGLGRASGAAAPRAGQRLRA
jgi:malonate transporter